MENTELYLNHHHHHHHSDSPNLGILVAGRTILLEDCWLLLFWILTFFGDAPWGIFCHFIGPLIMTQLL